MPSDLFISVPADEMSAEFNRILLKHGFSPARAGKCAEIFTASSVDGVYTHGVNRFARFVEYVAKGYVKPDAEPTLKNKIGGIEQWDGNLGPGPLNASFVTERAMQLAAQTGIGCITLSNTNHWMRGGTYGWQAAKKGFVLLAWTNTIANMPAWGAVDRRLGNNPLVMAIPYGEEAIVLDMAMSQFSFGAMELAKMKNEQLAMDGGFDEDGNLTRDPAAILKSGRPLSIGYWKGAGLSLLLDLLAALLSGGLATHEISGMETEYASQVFIAIDISKLPHHSAIPRIMENILNDYLQSSPVDEKKKIVYPGQRIVETRKENLQNGVPVLRKVWKKILEL